MSAKVQWEGATAFSYARDALAIPAQHCDMVE